MGAAILTRWLLMFPLDQVTVKYLQGLVDLINEHTANMEAGPEANTVKVNSFAIVCVWNDSVFLPRRSSDQACGNPPCAQAD